MKIYVLTDGQHEESVEGAFSSPELAMAARPDLQWQQGHDEDFPGGFWFGVNGLDFSRVWGLTVGRRRLAHSPQARARMAAEPAPPVADRIALPDPECYPDEEGGYAIPRDLVPSLLWDGRK